MQSAKFPQAAASVAYCPLSIVISFFFAPGFSTTIITCCVALLYFLFAYHQGPHPLILLLGEKDGTTLQSQTS